MSDIDLNGIVYSNDFKVLIKCSQVYGGAFDIKKHVVEIGESAFKDCDSLTAINIPNSVTKIGFRAFEGCSSLTTIIIPESVTEIEASAFKGCSNLILINVAIGNKFFSSNAGILFNKNQTELIQYKWKAGSYIVPNTVVVIQREAFEDCIFMESIYIPNNVTEIGWRAFDGCNNLRKISIPKGSLEKFLECGLKPYQHLLVEIDIKQ